MAAAARPLENGGAVGRRIASLTARGGPNEDAKEHDGNQREAGRGTPNQGYEDIIGM